VDECPDILRSASSWSVVAIGQRQVDDYANTELELAALIRRRPAPIRSDMTKFTVKERDPGKPCFIAEEETLVYFELIGRADLAQAQRVGAIPQTVRLRK
jgi:hypothetical protein